MVRVRYVNKIMYVHKRRTLSFHLILYSGDIREIQSCSKFGHENAAKDTLHEGAVVHGLSRLDFFK